MAKLNEMEKRRADFAGGTPVVMADGGTWFLARPLVRFTPTDGDGFRAVMNMDLAGDDYQDLLDAVEASGSEDAAPQDRVKAELAVGKAVLLRNYDLDAKELGRVLQFGFTESDPVGLAIREAVLDVAFGITSPKPSPVTSQSPSD